MDLEKELNEAQYRAASSTSKTLRIIAGAGTGKTRTLTYRLAYQILQGIPPRRMCAITFTNKAAREMLERVSALLKAENLTYSGNPLIVTFHGFCYRFLIREIKALPEYAPGFQIADDDDTAKIFKDIFKGMAKGESKQFCADVSNRISKLKTDGKFPEEVTTSDVPLGSLYTYQELMYVYNEYQRSLRSQNLMDFDDLLMLTCKVMEKNPDIRRTWQNKYDVFLVDEFQDTNLLQFYLIELFRSPDAYLTVVGDPDQTIYTWRGAENDLIKNRIGQRYPDLETVVLDENYRSTQSILDNANALINNNKGRMEKNLVAANKVVGDAVDYFDAKDGESEAYRIASSISRLNSVYGVKLSDIAIIYRSNYLSRALEKGLLTFRIPYVIYGGVKFYERAEIKDALSYLRLAINPDDFSFQRILKAPSKGIGDVCLERAKDLRQNVDPDMPLLELFRNYQTELKLTKPSIQALNIFFEAYDKFKNAINKEKDPLKTLDYIELYFNQTGFLQHVKDEDYKMQEKMSYTAFSSASKMENINELKREMATYFSSEHADDDGNPVPPTLQEFLLEVSLQSDQDTMEQTDKVSLMTGHVSKGLEFDYVFVTGLNQNVFPTSHALMDGPKAIEEERRLLYVCLTRARKKLTVSSFGGVNYINNSNYVKSMFLKEMPNLNKIGIDGKPLRNDTAKKQKTDYDAYRGAHKPSRPSLYDNFGKPSSGFSFANFALPQANPPKGKETYAIGDRIKHDKFGLGTVKELFQNNIIVEFDDANIGSKKLAKGVNAYRKVKEGE